MATAKPAHQRARRNKTSTHATLVRDHNIEAPELPDRDQGWHPVTLQYWADIWASPMAPEFEKDADKYGLFMLAALVDDFWRLPEHKHRDRALLAAEIRLGEARFGLAPYDRRRLQWTVESAEAAMDRGRERRARTVTPVDPSEDPRSALYSVS